MRPLTFIVLFLFCCATQAVEIKRVEASAANGGARVVFDASGAVDYQVFTMANPDRVVVDFKGARAARSLTTPNTRAVKHMAVTRRADGTLRVVLDLRQRASVDHRVLKAGRNGPYRVALDLTSVQSDRRTAQPAANASKVATNAGGRGAGESRATPAPKVAEGPAVKKPARADAGATSSRRLADRDVVAAKDDLKKTATGSPAASKVAARAGDGAAGRTRGNASIAKGGAVPAAQKSRPARPLVVAIDAGHGGVDVGAIGPTGVYEKDVTLGIARKLAGLINGQPGMRAVLTRDNDYYLPLRARIERARTQRADVFVSVHADAVDDRRVRGSSVYVLSQRGATSEAAKWLAEKQNADDLGSGVNLEDRDHLTRSVLLDMSQSASLDASMRLASNVLSSLRRIGPVHRSRVQQAGFVVLKSPDIPSVLVETAYISNPTEEKRLRDDTYRGHIARAIFDGVLRYAAQRKREPLRMAERPDPPAPRAAARRAALDNVKIAANLR